jgi:hypothetical protein
LTPSIVIINYINLFNAAAPAIFRLKTRRDRPAQILRNRIMSNRIIALAAAAAISTLTGFAAYAEDARSTVDGPRGAVGVTAADGAAAYGAGTVGAMHYAVAGRATNSADVRRESRNLLTTVHANFQRPAFGS